MEKDKSSQILSDGTEFILYQTEDGEARLEVKLENETVWLTQKNMAELFEKSVSTINEHIKNIFKEGELSENSAIRNFRITASDGKEYLTKFYNLDVIISVGYRVKSHHGTQFRIWATRQLKEYLIKGFLLNDEKFKQLGGGTYFEDLLNRIRDIRSSEKVFWRKVLNIYATSADYDPNTETSKEFFAIIQNKMHFAAHGSTAAEVIHNRANAEKSNMGMTSWIGKRPNKNDAVIAKNYLNTEELETLNRIVTLYLEFAELQARNRKIMYMKDWINKLDQFLQVSDHEILNHAGKISAENAKIKVENEFKKFKQKILNNEKSLIEEHFEEAVLKAEKLIR